MDLEPGTWNPGTLKQVKLQLAIGSWQTLMAQGAGQKKRIYMSINKNNNK
jgi:hypothetical protein